VAEVVEAFVERVGHEIVLDAAASEPSHNDGKVTWFELQQPHA
jgi:hypothetical protein